MMHFMQVGRGQYKTETFVDPFRKTKVGVFQKKEECGNEEIQPQRKQIKTKNPL